MRDIRSYVARRFPALADQPLIETRVCQYENSSNGDFLIDRHPGFENVVLVGGGSGHGFKHGPAVGRYAADLVSGGPRTPEPRFALASKAAVQAHGGTIGVESTEQGGALFKVCLPLVPPPRSDAQSSDTKSP